VSFPGDETFGVAETAETRDRRHKEPRIIPCVGDT
jgi:hypothetical protein